MRDPVALDALQERLGLQFRSLALLEQALRHRSVVLDRPRDSGERMEFLGDSIVGMVVCDYLYSHYPEASEGELAKAKAYVASEPVLAEAALALGLDQAVEISTSEEAAGGRQRRSILADAFEAVIAAVFLDQGVRVARRLVRTALGSPLKQVAEAEYHPDYKSRLQERLQATAKKTPHYKIASELGADHDKTFLANAMLGKKVIGEGTGKSKKQAEQAAAKHALETYTEPKRRRQPDVAPAG